MSKRKHNVAYIKPNEPKFLREMKEKIGYKEGPTVETKREALPEATDNDREAFDEEKPVVVVLNDGDLTAEEADAFTKQKEEEEAKTPADLFKNFTFRKKTSEESSSVEEGFKVKKKMKKEKQKQGVLSFDFNEDDLQ